MAKKISNGQPVVDKVEVENDAATAAIHPLLNKEINISNYMDYAQNLTYGDSGLQASIHLAPLMVNGQVVETYDTQNGVQAEAFVTTGAGVKRIVVGYAGTGVDLSSGTSSLYSSPGSATGSAGDQFTGAQFYDEVAILAGQTPTGAVGSATAFAKEVIGDAAQLGIKKNDIYLTGHNLGGTLAEYSAAGTGLAGTTFGAAGITIRGSAKAANFKNIVANGDPIGNYASNGSDPLDPLLLSSNIKHYGREELIGPQSNQQQLSTLASGTYAALTQPDAENNLGDVAGLFFSTAYNSLSPSYGYGYFLGTKVSVTDFGSYASPKGSQTSAPIATLGSTPGVPAPSLTTSIATPPSSQVVQQDINICNYLYSSKTEAFSDSGLGQLGLTPLLQNGKVVQVYNQKAGVYGQAFETTGAGSPKIVIAYEGTEPYGGGSSKPFSGGQLLDDAAFFAAKPAACITAVDQFANKVIGIAAKNGISKSDISLTGHSLGAAEAEYAAEATGLAGVTFGTPGIDITGNLPPSRLTNFVDNGDPVGNFGADGENALGNLVTSSQIQHYGGVTIIGTSQDALNAQANLESTAKNFFDPTDTADYKNLTTALFNLGEDFQYHHLMSYAISLDNSGYTGISVCYCTGTAIRTPRGDRAVEALRPGDLVVTASGETRPVKWIGHRSVDCRSHPRPGDVWPVRIAAHALGENRPARDLFVSPAHAICIDVVGEVLIPVGVLVNDRTVSRREVDRVTYWHVELETHDILLAENLPAESYLDMGNRGFFENAEVIDLAAGPDAAAPSHAGFCRPYVDAGPILVAVRARLDGRADSLPTAREARAA